MLGSKLLGDAWGLLGCPEAGTLASSACRDETFCFSFSNARLRARFWNGSESQRHANTNESNILAFLDRSIIFAAS